MVKLKHKQMGSLVTKKNKTSSGVVQSSKVGSEGNLDEDDDWVIVKKQRVTILVPPPTLPIPTERPVLRTHQVSTKPRKTGRRRNLSGSHCKYFVDEKSFAVASNVKRNFISPTMETAPEGPNLLVGESMVRRSALNSIHDHHLRHGPGTSKGLRVSGVAKAIKSQNAPQFINRHGSTSYLRRINCLNVATLQNRMMRASNLERKLEKAGGVSRWLISLGLGQFVKLFHRKNVDKFQLLNLTMEKLKEMGAKAVGPRRKLIHAIDCISQPYCFGTFRVLR